MLDKTDVALTVVDSLSAMVAFWDEDERCRFANQAYQTWFGKSREELLGTTLRSLLGPLYALNEPYLRRAYAGEVQTFERSIPRPDGQGARESLATYTPDIFEGRVRGIFVHVCDTSLLKETERRLQRSIEERDRALARLHMLEGLLSICASCKKIQTGSNQWVAIEKYISAHSNASFTHAICPPCIERLYPHTVE